MPAGEGGGGGGNTMRCLSYVLPKFPKQNPSKKCVQEEKSMGSLSWLPTFGRAFTCDESWIRHYWSSLIEKFLKNKMDKEYIQIN